MEKETKKTLNLAIMVLSILGIFGVFGYILYQSFELIQLYLDVFVLSIILAISGLGLIAHPSSKTTAVGVSALVIGMLLFVFFMI